MHVHHPLVFFRYDKITSRLFYYRRSQAPSGHGTVPWSFCATLLKVDFKKTANNI